MPLLIDLDCHCYSLRKMLRKIWLQTFTSFSGAAYRKSVLLPKRKKDRRPTNCSFRVPPVQVQR